MYKMYVLVSSVSVEPVLHKQECFALSLTTMRSKGKPELQFYPRHSAVMSSAPDDDQLHRQLFETVTLRGFPVKRLMFVAKGMLFSASPACHPGTSSHQPLARINSTIRAPCATQAFSSLQTISGWPLCPGCRSSQGIGSESAVTQHPKDLGRLPPLSYAVSAGPSALEGDSIFFFSHGSKYAQREKVPLVHRHVSEKLHIFARHGQAWEPSQAKGLCVYPKVLTCGHTQPQA